MSCLCLTSSDRAADHGRMRAVGVVVMVVVMLALPQRGHAESFDPLSVCHDERQTADSSKVPDAANTAAIDRLIREAENGLKHARSEQERLQQRAILKELQAQRAEVVKDHELARRRQDADAAILESCISKAEAEDRVLQARLASPANRQRAVSSAVCLLDDYRSAMLKEIATEKRYSKIGGVQNNLKLLQLQNRIRTIDEYANTLRRSAKSWKVTLLKCNAKYVQPIIACALNAGPCRPQEVQDASFFVQAMIEELDGDTAAD